MTIKKKRINSWLIDASVRINGKQRRKRLTVEGTKAEAEESFWRLKQELRGEPQSSPSCLKTFGDAIAFYKEAMGDFKLAYIFDRLKAVLGECNFKELKDRFYRFIQILKNDTVRSGQRIKPGTVNKYICFAKAICNYAVKYADLEASPLTDFPLLRLNNARDRVLSPDEEVRLFNSLRVKAPYLIPAVRFFLRIPIRKNELVSMKKDQVDLFHKVIYLREGTTKNGSGAILPIPPDMLEYFQNIPAQSEYVFFRYIIKRKEYVSLGDFKKAWKAVLLHAHISDFRIHDTRHQAAAYLGRNGTPESVIMKIGNWRTASVFRRYRHIFLDEIRDAVKWERPNLRQDCDTSTGTEG
ncbi:tyrosine-type recombinase/integrase [Fibrobacterota bacterium]